jgi:hypothetical protein
MPDIVILTPNTHGNEKTKTIIDKYPEKCGGKTYDYENEFCDIRVGENVVYKKSLLQVPLRDKHILGLGWQKT